MRFLCEFTREELIVARNCLKEAIGALRAEDFEAAAGVGGSDAEKLLGRLNSGGTAFDFSVYERRTLVNSIALVTGGAGGAGTFPTRIVSGIEGARRLVAEIQGLHETTGEDRGAFSGPSKKQTYFDNLR